MDTPHIMQIVLMVCALLISIIGHELMHGLVAYHYGDPTAKHAGRLSINPIKHIDIVGSLIIPALLYFTQAPFLFGWAKPVPVDIAHIIKTRGISAAIGVALAGVSYNLALALLASLILASGVIPSQLQDFTYASALGFLFLIYLIQCNIVLFVFNLLPIPPLDGAKALLFCAMKLRFYALVRFLEAITPYGLIIVFVLLCVPFLSKIVLYPSALLLRFLLP